MSYIIADLDAEAEFLLTRAEWAEARRGFYALGTHQRNDALYPMPVPAGAAWARRVTGVVAVDPGRVGTSTVRYRLLYDDPASDLVIPAGSAWGYYPRPADDLVAVTATIAPDLRTTLAPSPFDWVGRWVVDLAVPAAVTAAPKQAPPPRDWWYGSPWARQVALAFIPSSPSSGPFSGANQASDVVPFGGALDTDVVLIRSPHPFLPKAAVERQRAGPDVVVAGAARTPVRSRGVSYVRGPGHQPKRAPEGWLGLLYRKESQNIFEQVISSIESIARGVAQTVQQTGRNLAKAVTTGDLDALQAIAAATLVTVVTGGLGAGVAGQALQWSSIAGSDDPWRAAARVGAIHYAFFASPLTQAFRGGLALAEPLGGSASATDALAQQAVRPGLTELNLRTYSVAGMSVSADDVAAAEVWALRLAAVDPAEANRLLQQLVAAGGYVDLVLARLVIEAEANAQKRAALKAKVAVQQATFWNDYGQYIAGALAAVATALGVGPLAAAGFAILQMLYQAGVQAASIEVALDAQRRAELAAEREAQAIEAEIARLEAELASLPVPAGSDATGQGGQYGQGGQGGQYRSWYGWLVDLWLGKKSQV